MFTYEYPVFVSKKLLKIGMLNSLRDYPREVTELFFQDYGDGILSGCNIRWAEGQLEIMPGLICHGGMVYRLKKAWRIPCPRSNQMVYLKVKFFAETRENDKVQGLSQIILDGTMANERDEIELCRFHLQQGARLRQDYVDFEDFSTNYDTVNQIHAPFASKGGSTLWPLMLATFGKEMFRKVLTDPFDVQFTMSCLNMETVMQRAYIVAYINHKTRQQKEDYDNLEVYKELLKILRQGQGKSDNEVKREQREKKILLF